MDRPCIIPVAADDALAWAAGNLNDRDLLLHAPIRPEAIFLVNLPDRRSYAAMLKQAAFWHRAGARCLIVRTHNDIADDHLIKAGCLCTFRENTVPTSFRFLAGPEALAKWVAKFSKAVPALCLVLALAGCVTRQPVAPQAATPALAMRTAAAAQAPVASFTVTALFCPRGEIAATAFFEYSTNLTDWQRVTLDYPADGGWLTNTFPFASPAGFARCGFTTP